MKANEVVEKTAEFEKRVSDLIEQVENKPENWHIVLIERIIKQEIMLERCQNLLVKYNDVEKMNSLIIDNGYLEAPTFLRDRVEVRAINTLWQDQGFYDAEEAESGLLFRWTKQDFYVEVPVKRSEEKKVSLHLIAAIKPEVIEKVTCYANGEEVHLERIQTDKNYVYEGVLPADMYVHLTRLSFHTQTAFAPKEVNPDATDTRLLAVAFLKLVVE
ncbi:hypothetical protein [Sulfuricurvum sp.]|uniref:hypothetical protein n=1 Tax=Sulfuricurvum sp. TaxID=2025608 RepID=UPI00260470B3|nr:hypothetical protein [Sulfuricurvum sp.]MDD2781549.1 hypothetical protein [Sulfuricurvum sp.]